MAERITFKRVALGLVALFLLIQLVPYGRDHKNPPVVKATRWTSPAGAKLATESCYDCHSNKTKWKWYSHVAPISWLVANDVKGGRENLNFSDWSRGQPELKEIREAIASGEMPPRQYTLAHPGSKLSNLEKNRLKDQFNTLYGDDPPPIRQSDQ